MKVDIQALANLSRLSIAEDEVSALESKISQILDFVAQVSDLNVAAHKKAHPYARLREDVVQNELGSFTEAFLMNVPKKNGNAIVVPQVIKKK